MFPFIGIRSLPEANRRPAGPVARITRTRGHRMSFRRDMISKPIFAWARRVLPSMSDTEREALEAGDVWWDAGLFTGNPDWAKLLATAPAKLTADEEAFLNGQV